MWVLLLIAFVEGALHAEKISSNPTLKNAFTAVSSTCSSVPLPCVGLLLWLVVRILYALGVQLQFELLVVLSSATYLYRNIEREKKRTYYEIHTRLSESKDPSIILGSNLPEWVTFPSSQRVLWLNQTISSLWPSIMTATNETLTPILEKILMEKKPGMVEGFKVRGVHIGDTPIVINGIQHHDYGYTETTVDISISWRSSLDVHLLVKIPGPDMEVAVRDLSLRGNFRLTLGPHIPSWPCFANAMISILGSPEIDFRLKAAKIPLDSIPGLSSFLDTFIRRTLVSLLSFPKGFTYPIKPEYPLNIGFGAGALGVFSIKLEKVSFSAKFLAYHRKKFYFKLGLVGSEKKRRKSMSYIGVDSVLTDKFYFTLYDTTPIIRLWVYFDVTGRDVAVGITDIVVSDLMDNTRGIVQDHTLIKENDPTRKKRGVISFKTDYRALKNTEKTKTNPPRSLAPRRISEEKLHEMIDEGFVPVVPRVRGMPKASRSGILFISVSSASDLPNKETFSTSDPYIIAYIGDEVVRSDVVPSNLNPVFNFEAEILVRNVTRSILKIKIIDKNVEKDEFMCSTEVDLSRIGYSKNKQIEGNFKLYPQGNMLMCLSFIPFS